MIYRGYRSIATFRNRLPIAELAGGLQGKPLILAGIWHPSHATVLQEGKLMQAINNNPGSNGRSVIQWLSVIGKGESQRVSGVTTAAMATPERSERSGRSRFGVPASSNSNED